jgi:hypothetical protein
MTGSQPERGDPQLPTDGADDRSAHPAAVSDVGALDPG